MSNHQLYIGSKPPAIESSRGPSQLAEESSRSSAPSGPISRFSISSDQKFHQASIPGLGDIDLPVSARKTGPPTRSESVNSAKKILEQAGLGEEYLYGILLYPDEQISADSLPTILDKIHAQKLKNQTSSGQSRPSPSLAWIKPEQKDACFQSKAAEEGLKRIKPKGIGESLERSIRKTTLEGGCDGLVLKNSCSSGLGHEAGNIAVLSSYKLTDQTEERPSISISSVPKSLPATKHDFRKSTVSLPSVGLSISKDPNLKFETTLITQSDHTKEKQIQFAPDSIDQPDPRIHVQTAHPRQSAPVADETENSCSITSNAFTQVSTVMRLTQREETSQEKEQIQQPMCHQQDLQKKAHTNLHPQQTLKQQQQQQPPHERPEEQVGHLQLPPKKTIPEEQQPQKGDPDLPPQDKDQKETVKDQETQKQSFQSIHLSNFISKPPVYYNFGISKPDSQSKCDDIQLTATGAPPALTETSCAPPPSSRNKECPPTKVQLSSNPDSFEDIAESVTSKHVKTSKSTATSVKENDDTKAPQKSCNIKPRERSPQTSRHSDKDVKTSTSKRALENRDPENPLHCRYRRDNDVKPTGRSRSRSPWKSRHTFRHQESRDKRNPSRVYESDNAKRRRSTRSRADTPPRTSRRGSRSREGFTSHRKIFPVRSPRKTTPPCRNDSVHRRSPRRHSSTSKPPAVHRKQTTSSDQGERMNAEQLAQYLLEIPDVRALSEKCDIEAVVKALSAVVLADWDEIMDTPSSRIIGVDKDESKRSSSLSSHDPPPAPSPPPVIKNAHKPSSPTMVRLFGVVPCVTRDDVVSAVSEFGKTKSVILLRSRQEVVVCFEKEEDAKRLKTLEIKGCTITVRPTEPSSENIATPDKVLQAKPSHLVETLKPETIATLPVVSALVNTNPPPRASLTPREAAVVDQEHQKCEAPSTPLQLRESQDEPLLKPSNERRTLKPGKPETTAGPSSSSTEEAEESDKPSSQKVQECFKKFQPHGDVLKQGQTSIIQVPGFTEQNQKCKPESTQVQTKQSQDVSLMKKNVKMNNLKPGPASTVKTVDTPASSPSAETAMETDKLNTCLSENVQKSPTVHKLPPQTVPGTTEQHQECKPDSTQLQTKQSQNVSLIKEIDEMNFKPGPAKPATAQTMKPTQSVFLSQNVWECIDMTTFKNNLESACIFDLMLLSQKELISRNKRQLLITNLPPYRDGGYTENELNDLIRPYSPGSPINVVYIMTEARMALVIFTYAKFLHSLLQCSLVLEGYKLKLHVLNVDTIASSPILFLNYVIKEVRQAQPPDACKTIYFPNISQSKIKVLTEALKGNNSVLYILPVLSKFFVEFKTLEDSDQFGLWLHQQKHSFGTGIRRLQLPKCTDLAKNAEMNSRIPKGCSGPFSLTLPQTPYTFITATPTFLIPEYVSVSDMTDIERLDRDGAKLQTIMMTGFPAKGFTFKDIAEQMATYFPNTSLHLLVHKVIILPLQRRAFAHFEDWTSCYNFASKQLKNPLYVKGNKLHVHLVIDDLFKPYNEENIFTSMMKLSNSPVMQPESLADHLLYVWITEFSDEVFENVLKFMTSVGPFVSILPLANRICFEMANTSYRIPRFLPSQQFSMSPILRVESLQNLKRLLQSSIDKSGALPSSTEQQPQPSVLDVQNQVFQSSQSAEVPTSQSAGGNISSATADASHPESDAPESKEMDKVTTDDESQPTPSPDAAAVVALDQISEKFPNQKVDAQCTVMGNSTIWKSTTEESDKESQSCGFKAATAQSEKNGYCATTQGDGQAADGVKSICGNQNDEKKKGATADTATLDGKGLKDDSRKEPTSAIDDSNVSVPDVIEESSSQEEGQTSIVNDFSKDEKLQELDGSKAEKNEPTGESLDSFNDVDDEQKESENSDTSLSDECSDEQSHTSKGDEAEINSETIQRLDDQTASRPESTVGQRCSTAEDRSITGNLTPEHTDPVPQKDVLGAPDEDSTKAKLMITRSSKRKQVTDFTSEPLTEETNVSRKERVMTRSHSLSPRSTALIKNSGVKREVTSVVLAPTNTDHKCRRGRPKKITVSESVLQHNDEVKKQEAAESKETPSGCLNKKRGRWKKEEEIQEVCIILQKNTSKESDQEPYKDLSLGSVTCIKEELINEASDQSVKRGIRSSTRTDQLLKTDPKTVEVDGRKPVTESIISNKRPNILQGDLHEKNTKEEEGREQPAQTLRNVSIEAVDEPNKKGKTKPLKRLHKDNKAVDTKLEVKTDVPERKRFCPPASSGAVDQLAKFKSNKPFGQEFIQLKTGYCCSICTTFYVNERAMLDHCSSQKHCNNVKAYYQKKLQLKQMSTQKK